MKLISSATNLCASLTRLVRDQRGLAAIEFAMLLPLMLTLYLGGVELSQAIGADRQGTSVNNSEMTNILNAALAVVAPYPTSNLKVTVSSINVDAQGAGKIGWSDSYNSTARPVNQAVTLPSALQIPNTTLIWGEVSYAYTPTIGYIITGTMTLKDQIYMRPRQSTTVTRLNSG
jgi:Flp pilus assembly protein TadG